MNTILFAVLLLTTPASSTGANSLPLKCELRETTDIFLFYPEQMVYRSDQFVLFQNINGRVVTQVNLKNGDLIRTTYLGDTYNPIYQILRGKCNDAVHILDFWQLDDIPFDQ